MLDARLEALVDLGVSIALAKHANKLAERVLPKILESDAFLDFFAIVIQREVTPRVGPLTTLGGTQINPLVSV